MTKKNFIPCDDCPFASFVHSAKDCRDYCEDNNSDTFGSASSREFSPSNPWDAPGMSVRDFIR